MYQSTLKFVRDGTAAVKVSLLSWMSETQGNRNVADENMELMLKTRFSMHVLKHQNVSWFYFEPVLDYSGTKIRARLQYAVSTFPGKPCLIGQFTCPNPYPPYRSIDANIISPLFFFFFFFFQRPTPDVQNLIIDNHTEILNISKNVKIAHRLVVSPAEC